MEEQEPLGYTQAGGSQHVWKEPRILQSGSIAELLRRIPGAQRVQEEPCEGLFQHWEAQWQEFLRAVDSPQSHWAVPQLPKEPRLWDDTKAFWASFEQVAQGRVGSLAPASPQRGSPAGLYLAGSQRQRGLWEGEGGYLAKGHLEEGEPAPALQALLLPRGRGAKRDLQPAQRTVRRVAEGREKHEGADPAAADPGAVPGRPACRDQSWVRERGLETCALAVALAEDFLQMPQEANRRSSRTPCCVFQVPILLEGATTSCVEVAQKSPGPGGRKPNQEVTRKCDRNVSVLDNMEVSKFGEENGGQLENPELAKAFQRRVTENFSQVSGARNTSEDPYGSKRQQRNCPRRGICQCLFGEALTDRSQPDVLLVADQMFWPLTDIAHCKGYLENLSGEAEPAVGKSLARHQGNPHVIPGGGLKEALGLPKRKQGLTLETPFQCPKCGKSLSRKDHLVRHLHIHLAEKSHRCPSYGKMFFEHSDLIRHERIHIGERPHKCSFCEKRFSHKWLSHKHERIHMR
ncbi:hypothetical protein EYD10_17817 [Varanus komodoensis]|nr:hypothetical protein EYD10_17817 [Varanus komodoensis]